MPASNCDAGVSSLAAAPATGALTVGACCCGPDAAGPLEDGATSGGGGKMGGGGVVGAGTWTCRGARADGCPTLDGTLPERAARSGVCAHAVVMERAKTAAAPA